MGLGTKVNKEVREWGSLAIVIVIISIILLKFKSGNVGDAICPSTWLNETSNFCCIFNSTGGTSPAGLLCSAANRTSLATTGVFLDTMVTAISEPKNWVIIVIIAIIGIALFKFFSSGKKGGL